MQALNSTLRVFHEGESYQKPNEKNYEAWLIKAEKLLEKLIPLGSALEDEAFSFYDFGASPQDFVNEVNGK